MVSIVLEAFVDITTKCTLFITCECDVFNFICHYFVPIIKKWLMCMRFKLQEVFLSIKNFKFKTDFLFLKRIFACKVVPAKLQSIFDNIYNILSTAKNNSNHAAGVQYLRTG